MNIQDRSSYLKGLLIIAKKDNQLAESEKEIIRGVANKLGFASDFYEETLRSLLANKYIADDPIKFSDAKIAQSFIVDGLILAYSDNQVSEKEIVWLKSTAEFNNISSDWFEKKIQQIKNSSNLLINKEFALYSII